MSYRAPNRMILEALETLGYLIKLCSFGRHLILALEGWKLTEHFTARMAVEMDSLCSSEYNLSSSSPN